MRELWVEFNMELTVGRFFGFVVQKFELEAAGPEKVDDLVDDQRVQTGILVVSAGCRGRPGGRRVLRDVVRSGRRIFDQSQPVKQFHFRLLVDPVKGRQQLVLDARSKLRAQHTNKLCIIFLHQCSNRKNNSIGDAVKEAFLFPD